MELQNLEDIYIQKFKLHTFFLQNRNYTMPIFKEVVAYLPSYIYK